jgi:hypothetical protein
MTFQPPPPPPPPPGPPTPPPGQWGPPPGQGPSGGGAFDPKSVDKLDWGIMAAGLLAFIFSLFDYYTFTAKGAAAGFGSTSESAWSGFFGWFGALVALVGGAAVALTIFMPHVKLPLANRLISVLAFGVSTVCVILALIVVPDIDGGGPGYDKVIDEGHGFGFWASFVVIIAGLVLSLMRAQQTGTALPGPLDKMPKIGK